MPKPSDAGPVLRPVIPPRNLTREIAERIADHIASAKLLPGARLPTEQEMVAAMGVSRTVVREAVAALRADGLVVTRQGAGAFVAPDADLDAQAAAWLAQRSTQATPRELAPVPIFGYPGWLPGSERPEFYDDTRYFRRAYGNAG